VKDEGMLLMLFFGLQGTVSVVSFNARGAWGSCTRILHLHVGHHICMTYPLSRYPLTKLCISTRFTLSFR
jgi:hypothetical protein